MLRAFLSAASCPSMKTISGVTLLSLAFFAPSDGLAQQKNYPTVIGPTGRPYGPTQAEFQYQRRYGRPSAESQLPGSPGMNYVNGQPGGGVPFFNQFYIGFDPYFYNGYGPGYYPGYDPRFRGYGPSTTNYNLLYSPNFGPGGMPGVDPADGPPATVNPLVMTSTPQAIEQSLNFQAQGDDLFRQLNYLGAADRYRRSSDIAQDRPEPRYRLAVALVARGRYGEAVDHLKQVASFDPNSAQKAASLEELFGVSNFIEKTLVRDGLSEWALRNTRDSDRLFLLGAIMYLDGDPNSRPMIERAMSIAGQQPYLIAFLGQRVSGSPTPNQSYQGHTVPGTMVSPVPTTNPPANPPTPLPPQMQLPGVPSGDTFFSPVKPLIPNGTPTTPTRAPLDPRSSPAASPAPTVKPTPATPIQDIEGPLLP